MSLVQNVSRASEKDDSIKIAWKKKTAKGNCCVLVVASNNAGLPKVPSRWKRVGGKLHVGPLNLNVFIRADCDRNEPAVVVRFPSKGFFTLSLLEISNPGTSPVDAVVSDFGDSTQAASGGIGTTLANEDWLGIIAVQNNYPILDTPADSYTRVHNPKSGGGRNQTKVGHIVLHRTVTTSGTIETTRDIDLPDGQTIRWIALSIALSNTNTNPGQRVSGTISGSAFMAGHPTGGGSSIEFPQLGSGGVPVNFPVRLAISQGKIWTAGGRMRRRIWSSPDSATWTQHSHLFNGPVIAIAGDHNYTYAWEHRPDRQRLWRIAPTTAELFSDTQTERFPLDMVAAEGFLYRWTGNQIWEYFTALTSEELPLDEESEKPGGTKVYDSGIDASAATGRIVATDNGVVAFAAQAGLTEVYQYIRGTPEKPASARRIWKLPLGFTGRGMCYHLGAIWIAGDNNGKASLWAMNLQQEVPLYLADFRPEESFTVRDVAPGLGPSILVGASTGGSEQVFVYDASLDALSPLGSLAASDGTIHDILTFQDRRVVGLETGTSLKAGYFEPDSNTASTTEFELEDAAWDYDLPSQQKILHGVKVNFSPFVAGQTIAVEYKIDEEDDFVALTPISSANTGAGETSKWLQISDETITEKFYSLRLKVTATGVAGSPVEIYSYGALAGVLDYTEIWELRVRLEDEEDQDHPDDQLRQAEEMRDSLMTLIRSKNVVSFLDGWRYRYDEGKYTPHKVVIELPEDSIGQGAEGSMRLRLRSVEQ
jgi:hypothetical protein